LKRREKIKTVFAFPNRFHLSLAKPMSSGILIILSTHRIRNKRRKRTLLAVLPRIRFMLRYPTPLHSPISTVQANDAKECVLPFEDYEECLFHTKELLRLKIVGKEIEKKREANLEEKIGVAKS
jgi:hypothetical protein